MAIFSSENFNRPFEMLVHITDYLGGMNFMGVFDANIYKYGLYLRTENGQTLRFQGTSPEFNSRPILCNYKIRRDAHNTLHIYDMDNEGELVTSVALQVQDTTDATWELGDFGNQGASVRASFTLDHFRFRWIDDE
jgi:hypothetical protein